MPTRLSLRYGPALALAACLAAAAVPAHATNASALSPMERLGKAIFFDASLSEPAGQACASCHAPENGFVGHTSAENNPGAVEPGAVEGRFGNRKPPSAAYAGFSPPFHFDAQEKLYIGGQFWDGRAATLQEQAGQPFLNPVEMNNADAKIVCDKVADAAYAQDFISVFGAPLECAGDASADFTTITRALAAYERSPEVSAFTSKYDYYLRGQAQLSALEKQGLDLFNAEKKGNCAACHPSDKAPDGAPPLFTDFSYDNLGLPANPRNPFPKQPTPFNPDGTTWKDKGLGAVVKDPSLYGAFKVATLRNVARVPEKGFLRAYGHNGVLNTLKDVVHFYNTRDVKGAAWPAPEFPETMNKDELGDLKLTDAEEDAIVAFLQTLTDGFDPNTGRYKD